VFDATASRVRLRDPACLGRARPVRLDAAGPDGSRASRRQSGTDASGVAAGPPPQPGHGDSRREDDDPVASII
jgi:hypothetical protein